MIKRTISFLMTLIAVFCFAGCSTPEAPQSSNNVEIIIEEETIIEGGSSMTEENSSTVQNNESIDSPVSSEEPTSSVVTSSEDVSSNNSSTETKTDINYEWKNHPEDYKLLAFTFDDGPTDLMQNYVKYFAAFDGAGTFFVNGTSIKSDYDYNKMQEAINYGWDIGNHGDKHLVATIGGTGGTEATYDVLRADICDLIHKLESNLKTRDGAPYQVKFYRPPNIKPTANTFKICGEENLAVIWLARDALDWGSNSKDDSYNVLKNGIGKWKDGDIILCHETSQNTYEIIQEVLPDYFRAGYRFCSISELMQMRNITIDQISGELNNVDNNRGMVTNILDAAKAGKK